MLKLKWTSTTITNEKQAREIFCRIKELPLTIGAFDTETTGLHIINDKPFIFIFGFIMPDVEHGETYAIDMLAYPALSRRVIKTWHKYAAKLNKYLAHNVKFDLHMLENNGTPYEGDNLSDTQFYIRYAHDALTPDNGGAPLKLKLYAAQYITPTAGSYEKVIDQEKSAIAKSINGKLKLRLAKCGAPPAKYTAKSYTIGVIEDIFKDCILTPEDLELHVAKEYLTWLEQDVPATIRERMLEALVSSDDIPYTMLNRDNVLKYAHYDVIWVLEIYLACNPVIKARQNEIGLKFEEDTIRPLLEMESVGFLADKEYLEQARTVLKQYIRECRVRLWNAVQTEFKVGQSELIQELVYKVFNVKINSTNKTELELLVSSLKRKREHPELIDFVERLTELRTLEKWYSAYIKRFQNNLRHCDKLYTQINQVGTVSGRVTSDFQQFPRDAIVDRNNKELFHPRKIVKAEDGLIYLDYSQIELRFQALYTILVGHPDLNLCRAYMPYKCYRNSETKIFFDYNKPEDIKTYTQYKWFHEEDNVEWAPTDVHGATTTYATGLKKGDEGFKEARYAIGKRTNFAKNYGAKYKKICEMFPEKTEEECHRIDDAYYLAFPGVKEYHKYCYDVALSSAYGMNLFGIKYYGVTGHKLINLLIQGSAAYYLKWKIKQLYDYRQQHSIKTKTQMQIHDELSFKRNLDDSLNIFFEFQKIMQDWSDTLIPIVAEMEVTKTNWAEKKEVHSLNDLQVYFSD